MLRQERISFDHGRSWHMLVSEVRKTHRDMLLLYVIGMGLVMLSFMQLPIEHGEFVYVPSFLLQLSIGVGILILTPFIRYGMEVAEDARDEKAEWEAVILGIRDFEPLNGPAASVAGRALAAKHPLEGMAQHAGELVAVSPPRPARYRLHTETFSFVVPRAVYEQWLDLGRPPEVYYSTRSSGRGRA
jgi:hypothetical protein